MTQYTLIMGLNDKDTKVQQINTLEAYKIVSNLCTTYTDGATIKEALGVYKHDDGTIITETSLQIDLMFIEREKVLEIAKTLKKLFNQESIVFQTQTLDESNLI